MTCRETERLLLEQETQRLQRPEVVQHLEECLSCRRYQETLRANRKALSPLQAGAVPTGLAQRAIAQWEADTPMRTPRPLLLRLRPAFAAVAAFAAIGGLIALAHRSPGTPPPSRPVTAPSFALKQGTSPSPRSGAIKAAVMSSPTTPPEAIAHAEDHNALQPPRAPLPPLPRALQRAPEAAPRQDDLAYVNIDPVAYRDYWRLLPPGESIALETSFQRLRKQGDDFISIPYPRLAGDSPRLIAEAIAAYKQEAAIIDTRLARKVTVEQKAMAFSDLCKWLTDQTGIRFYAGRSIEDDKVTLFCSDRPLRDIMREISEVFGFKWMRSGKGTEEDPKEFAYTLYQDTSAQLAEEEQRNHDRNAALLALDREMERYRKYLDLTPEMAREQAALGGPDQKLLENLAGPGWAAAHLYFGLGPDQLAALRSGQPLNFSGQPEQGDLSLPPGVGTGILQSMDNTRIQAGENGGLTVGSAQTVPNGVAPSAFPGVQPSASLTLSGEEVGQFALQGTAGLLVSSGNSRAAQQLGLNLATGVSPSVKNPQNAELNAKQAKDPTLQDLVTIEPEATCQLEPDPLGDSSDTESGPKVTTADVLEAIHKATRRDIVSDYYTRLYTPDTVSARKMHLFDALNHLADAMHDHWKKDNDWLQFRSVGYFNDRVKEVPNRLLTRWAASRRKNQMMTAQDLMEVASLSDTQLNAHAMAEGARACFGLKEWELGRSADVRPHWRFLASLPLQLQEAAWSADGLKFEQLPLAFQQQFIALGIGPSNTLKRAIDFGIGDITNATLKVVYARMGNASTRRVLPGGPNAPKGDMPPGARIEIQERSATATGDPNAPGKPKPHWDIAFTYNYGNVHTGITFERVIRSHSMSMGSKREAPPGQNPTP